MKIEAGKRYVTRDGRVTGQIERYGGGKFAWHARVDGIPAYWTRDGFRNGSTEESYFDLISEYHEPKPEAGITREWIESEIAIIERHLQGQPSQTLAALKLALERLDQIAAEKPKETVARQIETIISEEYANWHGVSPTPIPHWHVSAAKRMLREVVAGIVEQAFVAGFNQPGLQPGKTDSHSTYTARIIKEACGE